MKTLNVAKDIQVFDAGVAEVKPELSREGFLRVAVNAARCGILVYKDEKGKTIRALRRPEEVFKPESMATLAGKPATYTHPSQLLDATTARGVCVGATGDNPHQVGEFLRVMASIFDGVTVNAIKNGKVEVSVGALADMTFEDGIDPDYGPYDMVQRNLRYNHLAFGLEDGRGGPEVRVLMDSTQFTVKTEDDEMAKPAAVTVTVIDGKKDLVKVKMGDAEHDMTPALADAIKGHLDSMEAAHQSSMDALGGELAAKLKKAADDADAELEAMAGDTEGECADDAAKALTVLTARPLEGKGARRIKDVLTKLLGKVEGLTKEVKTVMDSATIAPDKLAVAAREQARLVATVVALDSKAEPAKLFLMSATDLKKAAILARDPKAVFDGKDQGYIDGRFDAVATGLQVNLGVALGNALLDNATAALPVVKEVQDAKDKPARWTPQPLTASSRPAPTTEK